MKYGQCDVGEIPESRIVESHYCVCRRRFIAVRSETRGRIQWRITAAIRAAVEVHGVRKMSSQNISIFAEQVAAIQRVGSRERKRFESVSGSNSARSAKYLRQHLVGRRHLGRVLSYDGVVRQVLSQAERVRTGITDPS